jgi:hypothetical protein
LRTDPRCLALKTRLDELVAIRAREGIVIPHWEDADGPTECVFVHAQDFKALIWESAMPTAEYARWYLDTDLTSTYEYERTLLQVLQSQAPGTWSLKLPSHAGTGPDTGSADGASISRCPSVPSSGALIRSAMRQPCGVRIPQASDRTRSWPGPGSSMTRTETGPPRSTEARIGSSSLSTESSYLYDCNRISGIIEDNLLEIAERRPAREARWLLPSLP